MVATATENLLALMPFARLLGIVAQGRGGLDEAEEWCRKSLGIEEELGNRPGMAFTYGQLGLLAEARGQLEALVWTIRCSCCSAPNRNQAPGKSKAGRAISSRPSISR